MTAHKHAALMLQYAQDAAETDRPWERWEASTIYDGGIWIPCEEGYTMWHRDCKYRRKPQPLECWAVRNPDGRIYATTISQEAAEMWANGGRTIVRMREVVE